MTDFSALVSGYQRFRSSGWSHQRERWAELAEGQAPKVMVIACSDSRVDPATIFDTSPGEMFVVRNVANLVPPFEMGGGRHGVSAALEFAVTQLGVPEILVMGHGQCGGCRAALTQGFKGAIPGEGGFIANWIDMLDEAREEVVAKHGDSVSPEALLAMEHEAIKVSLANLRTFACIREREADGRIQLHGAFFAIDDGGLYLLDEASGQFNPA
jgi:carbonic anhydrase